jgi:hypothetical protein
MFRLMGGEDAAPVPLGQRAEQLKNGKRERVDAPPALPGVRGWVVLSVHTPRIADGGLADQSPVDPKGLGTRRGR